MPDFRFLLRVSRTRFWIYIFGPYLIGLAAAAVERADFFTLKTVVFGIYFTFSANLLIYGINDIFDYETDKLNKKKQDYEQLVKPEQNRTLLINILIFNLPFIAAAFFISFSAATSLIAFLFFSVFYSAPPIRAKTKPFLDSAFNILYVFPGVFAYQMISGNFPPLLVILAAGFWTCAMHAYSAIPDIQADRDANLKTIATQLGANATLAFCLIFYLASAILVYQYLGVISIGLGVVYSIIILLSYLLNKQDRLFTIYKFFPVINAGAGFIIFWFIVFTKFL